jgi:CubicO group peptidase (beta-lactamase class C family)
VNLKSTIEKRKGIHGTHKWTYTFDFQDGKKSLAQVVFILMLFFSLLQSGVSRCGAVTGEWAARRAELEAFSMGYALSVGKQSRGRRGGVVVKDGQVLFSKGYGYADLEARIPVDPATTLFRPGSVSKLFTWTAVMQLVEQGQLSLDEDINAYLDFQIPQTFPEAITLKHLLTHTAGFEDKGQGIFQLNAEAVPALRDYLSRTCRRVFFHPARWALIRIMYKPGRLHC